MRSLAELTGWSELEWPCIIAGAAVIAIGAYETDQMHSCYDLLAGAILLVTSFILRDMRKTDEALAAIKDLQEHIERLGVGKEE